jgi:hypothetical protein
MKNHASWLVSLTFVLGAACTAQVTPAGPPPAQPMPPPPAGEPAPPPPAGPPMAVDNGQPKMHATLEALERAHNEMTAASPNHGGHRERTLQLIAQAREEVKAGIEYANAHPTEIGPAEGAARPEPVSGEVAGAQKQPHMRDSMIALREARKQLIEAKGDKGGHRARALELIEQAMVQAHDGIIWADQHR